MRTISLGPSKRKDGESYEAYKKRQRDEQRRLKAHLRGTIIWDSEKQGTFVRQKQ